MDFCLSSPCETGAMCVNLMGNNNYECLCPPGFEGSNCAQNINDCEGASCPVNSSCMDGVNSFECTCVSVILALQDQTVTLITVIVKV